MSASTPNTILALLAKAPVAGKVKTRLIPCLGAQGSANLARRMLEHGIATSQQAIEEDEHLSLLLCLSPAISDLSWSLVAMPDGVTSVEQVAGDLGARMSAAVDACLSAGHNIILLGCDCPALTTENLHWANKALLTHDSCMIPSLDGGYVLLGLRRALPPLFQNMPWSTPQVAALARQCLTQHGFSLAEASPLMDIDEAADLVHLPVSWEVASSVC